MANKPDKPKNPDRRVELSPQPKSGQRLTADQQENWKKWSQLVAQAWADDKFKQRLLAEPVEVLKEHGMEVPAGLEVRVVENTDKVANLLLPPKPAGDVTQVTSSQLGGVVGGAICGPSGPKR